MLAIRSTMASMASPSVTQTSSTDRWSRLPAGWRGLAVAVEAVTGLRMLTIPLLTNSL